MFIIFFHFLFFSTVKKCAEFVEKKLDQKKRKKEKYQHTEISWVLCVIIMNMQVTERMRKWLYSSS